MKKMPPLEKVYEAFSAIADDRVEMGDGDARVASSNGEKTYTVKWDGDTYAANDSATVWQGYPGYPVLAVLMLQGRLPFERRTAELFAGIDWNALNKKYKRDYAGAAAEVLGRLQARGSDTGAIASEAAAIHAMLAELPLTVKRGGGKKTK